MRSSRIRRSTALSADSAVLGGLAPPAASGGPAGRLLYARGTPQPAGSAPLHEVLAEAPPLGRLGCNTAALGCLSLRLYSRGPAGRLGRTQRTPGPCTGGSLPLAHAPRPGLEDSPCRVDTIKRGENARKRRRNARDVGIRFALTNGDRAFLPGRDSFSSSIVLPEKSNFLLSTSAASTAGSRLRPQSEYRLRE